MWKMLRRTSRVSCGLAVATVFAGCGQSVSDSSTHGTTADMAAITAAFNYWWDIPSTCLGLMNTGSLKVAEVSGVGWAIATFRPPSDCVKNLNPAFVGGPPRTEPISSIAPWGNPSPQDGVFERLPGANWRMNQSGGFPFPCPAPGGAAPGLPNGALPPAVLAKFNLKYAPDCANVHYPDQPRR